MAKTKSKAKERAVNGQTEKLDVNKEAWSWVDSLNDTVTTADITDEHIRRAYRLYFPLHHGSNFKGTKSCKSACKQNPRCYSNIGIEKWVKGAPKIEKDKDASDVSSQEDSEEDEDEEDELEKRRSYTGKNGLSGFMPVGLKNLGNTCYVNSLLQIWFHNVTFRKAIYRWV